MDASLEHFAHIENVVAFVKSHLPPEVGPEAWKRVCEDVLHCELTKVEPLLTKQLATQDAHAHQEEEIRALLRAASWYTHPQLPTEALLHQAKILRTILAPQADGTIPSHLETIQVALQQGLSGHEALPAAQAIEAILRVITQNPVLSPAQIPAHELRDQIYYQLLYPHWFAIVNQWKQTQTKNVPS